MKTCTVEEEIAWAVGQTSRGHPWRLKPKVRVRKKKGGSLKGASGTEGEESREPTLRDLTGMIQTLMEQQEAGELKQREEVTWQEQQFC